MTKPAHVNHGSCSICSLPVGQRYRSAGSPTLCIPLPHAAGNRSGGPKTDVWLFAADKETDEDEEDEP